MRVPGCSMIAAALLLSACQNGRGAADAPVSAELPPSGSTWRLVSGLPDKLPADVTISLQFGADGLITGYGGCNRYSSQMSVEGGSPVVQPIVASKRGCLGAAGLLEPQYFAAMAKVSGLSSDATRLRLALSDGGELVFEPVPDSAGQ